MLASSLTFNVNPRAVCVVFGEQIGKGHILLFNIPLWIIIQKLSHLSKPTRCTNKHDQPAYYHILGLHCDFKSDSALEWIQSKDVNITEFSKSHSKYFGRITYFVEWYDFVLFCDVNMLCKINKECSVSSQLTARHKVLVNIYTIFGIFLVLYSMMLSQ